MKKNAILLGILIAFITLVAYSQTSNLKTTGSSQNTKYIYCELIHQARPFFSGSNNNAFLNFGTKSTYQNQSQESSSIKLLKDGVDALNYMSENDWEFVVKNDREITNGIETVYLFRKKK